MENIHTEKKLNVPYLVEVSSSDDARSLKDVIIASLEDSKAEDIVTIDLKGKSDMADYMVIATGRVNRHVAAIADSVADKLKDDGLIPQMEGMESCDWVLIDAYDVIVHVFRPEIRELYNLEKMWKNPLPSA